MTFITPFVSVLLSALMLSLGIPNELFKLGVSAFALIALVPLYLAFADSRSWRGAALLGGTMMMLVHLMSSFWLANFRDFAIFTLGGSALLNFAFGALAGWLLRYALTFPERVRPFIFAAVWTLWEWFKSSGFFAYPWGTLVMASRGLGPLIQIADVTGTWGISFLLALLAGILAEGYRYLMAPVLLRSGWLTLCGARRLFPAPIPPRSRRPLAEISSDDSSDACLPSVYRLHRRHFRRRVPAALPPEGRPPLGESPLLASALVTAIFFALALSYGTLCLLFPPRSETSLDVVIVQQNADSWEDGGVRKAILTSQELTLRAVGEAGRKPDLVVWSESTLPWPYSENRGYYQLYPQEYPVGEFLRDIGAPLLVGSPVVVNRENKDMSNSVILVAPDGTQLDWYGKIQMVPFAEYMPFTEYKIVRDFFDAIVGFSRGWTPGKELKTLSVTAKNGTRIAFATPICFEDAFPALVAKLHNTGSDLLINLTNDSWSRTDSAEYQHFAIASFRTIELRTTMIRSTNAGYSVVIDPCGRVIADMPLFAADSRFVSVPVYPHRTTFYARFGDWFPAILALLVLCAATIRTLDRRMALR